MTTKESSCGKILPPIVNSSIMPFRSSPTMFFLSSSWRPPLKLVKPILNTRSLSISVSFPNPNPNPTIYYYCAVDKHTIEIREVIHTYCTWWYPNKPSPITLTILDSGSSTVFLLGCGGAHYATILDSLFLLGDEKNTLTKKLFTLYTPLFLQ